MKYSVAQIAYHWLTVVFIAVLVLSGLAYTYDWAENNILSVHQIVGQILILVIAVRLGSRLFGHQPVSDKLTPTWESRAAQVVHLALYAVIVAYLTTGYVAASGLRDPMLVAPISQSLARSDLGELFLEAHFALKWVLLGLFAIHLAAVAKHHFWDQDDTLFNMTPTFRKD
ncbi:MAG: cytochrome b/b6 domain-containing protein [Pseudomonadota bacterium]